MRTRLQRNYAIAADRMAAVLRARDAAERKNGFNPAQPRTAAGNGPESGRWLGDGLGVAAGHVVGGLNHAADMVSRGMGRALAPISRQIDEAIAHAPPKVRAFLSENRAAIESTLGGLQAAGGVPQIVEGAELIGAGAATFPEGAPLIVVGGAMVAHGYDDWKTGLRALATGQAEPGGFYNLLRDSGFDDQAAKIALATTAGLPATAVRTLSRTALEDAADAVLQRQTLAILASPGVVITADGSSLFRQADIMRRGLIAEAYNLKITGSTPTPPGFKTFDAYRDGGSTGISVKTLDVEAPSYRRQDRRTVLTKVKTMVDDVANFTKAERKLPSGEPFVMTENGLKNRELHIYLPAGRVEPGQAAQIRIAKEYAEKRGVKLITRLVH